MSLAIMFVAQALNACVLVSAAEVDLVDRNVHLKDIVSSECLGERQDQIGALVVAQLPVGSHQRRLSRQTLADLARRAAPMLPAFDIDDGDDVVLLRRSASQESVRQTCHETNSVLPAGRALSLSAVNTTPCRVNATVPMLRYGSDGVRAETDLAAGSYLGPLLLEQLRVEAGDRLTISASVGPVRIEREVEALQAGREGQKIFVRDEDDAIFAMPVHEVAP